MNSKTFKCTSKHLWKKDTIEHIPSFNLFPRMRATVLHCFLNDFCQNAKKNGVTAAWFVQVRVLFITTAGLHHGKQWQGWLDDISKAFQRKPRNTEGAILNKNLKKKHNIAVIDKRPSK